MKKVLLAVCLLLCVVLCASCGETQSDATLTSIKITQAPTKTTYVEGETFDKTGMTVTGVWSDGTEKEITAYSVDKTVLTANDTVVTVTYKGLSATQAITVTAAAGGNQQSGDNSGNQQSGDNGGQQSGGTNDTLVLVNHPVRTLYVAGETFDPTGILLREAEGDTLYTACTYSTTPLTAGTSSVAVRCGDLSVNVPVTVVAGTAMTFTGIGNYSDQQYTARFDELTNDNTVQRNIDIGLSNANRQLTTLLPDPYPTGVGSYAQLVAETDYHLFYGLDSMVIKVNYAVDDLEQTLDRLYFDSEFAGACMSIKGQQLNGGYVQIVVKYYGDDLISVMPTDKLPTQLDFGRTVSTRAADYAFSTIREDGISVYNSEQAIYALSHGMAICPVPGSPVNTVLNEAKRILCLCCDDTMSEYQKLYNVYYYIIEHTAYDIPGEEWAGFSLEPVYESDMYSARLISFRAEGPILYGNAACYGYAKAITLLLGLEGLDITRVVAPFTDEYLGRSQIYYDSDFGEYQEGLVVHSYSYVRIDGYDYLIDGTYAYGGTVRFDNNGTPEECVRYRDFAVGLTFDEHRNVYRGLATDSYCRRNDYNPDSFNLWALTQYDGTHDCIVSDNTELAACLGAMAAKITQDQQFYAFSVAGDAAAYTDYYQFRDAVLSAMYADIFPASNWYYFGGARTVDDVTVYAIFMVMMVVR